MPGCVECSLKHYVVFKLRKFIHLLFSHLRAAAHMAQALIGAVRQGQGRNLHPRRGRTKRFYPTEFK